MLLPSHLRGAARHMRSTNMGLVAKMTPLILPEEERAVRIASQRNDDAALGIRAEGVGR